MYEIQCSPVNVNPFGSRYTCRFEISRVNDSGKLTYMQVYAQEHSPSLTSWDSTVVHTCTAEGNK